MSDNKVNGAKGKEEPTSVPHVPKPEAEKLPETTPEPRPEIPPVQQFGNSLGEQQEPIDLEDIASAIELGYLARGLTRAERKWLDYLNGVVQRNQARAQIAQMKARKPVP